MFGTVLIYDAKSGKGMLEDSKGDVYLFDDSSVAADTVPHTGMHVWFQLTKESQLLGRTDYVIRTLPRFEWSAS